MLYPASGTGQFSKETAKVIRFAYHGCTNRPFFHIVAAETKEDAKGPVIEQLGTYDPMPNQYNEKLVSLNLERIRYWIGNGADITRPVAQLLGLSGLLPIHPTSYMEAWRNRQKLEKLAEEAKAKPEETS